MTQITQRTVYTVGDTDFDSEEDARRFIEIGTIKQTLIDIFHGMPQGDSCSDYEYATAIAVSAPIFYAALKAHLEPEPVLQPVNTATLRAYVRETLLEGRPSPSESSTWRLGRILYARRAELHTMLEAHALWCRMQGEGAAPAIALPGPVEDPASDAAEIDAEYGMTPTQLSTVIEQMNADAEAIAAEPEPIPEGIVFHKRHDCFYTREGHNVCRPTVQAFREKWYDRRAEFPKDLDSE